MGGGRERNGGRKIETRRERGRDREREGERKERKNHHEIVPTAQLTLAILG